MKNLPPNLSQQIIDAIMDVSKSKIDSAITLYGGILCYISYGGKISESEEFYLERLEQVLDNIHTK